MKVKYKSLKTVVPIKIDNLKNLHTGSLLSRLNSLRALPESFEFGDLLPEERDAMQAADLLVFKNTTLWEVAFKDVKAILSEREHIPRGSKEKRQQAAREKKHR